MKHTSKDIAKLSGVSRGTVDRVIHHRGKVSEEAKRKVEQVLKDINYQPNILAKALQANQLFKIAVLMPSPENDVFWKEPLAGIEEAQSEEALFDVACENFFFDRKNKDNFKKMADRVLQSQPAGIILAPSFYREALDFLVKCKEKEIPCVTFNTHIDSDDLLSFVGQDLHQSGRVAADLLYKITPVCGTVLVVHFNENISNARHIQEKEIGFREYYNERKKEGWKIQTLSIKEENQQAQFDQLDTFFSNDPNIVAAFVTTSKTYQLAQYLAHNQIQCSLGGYDLLEKNIAYLKSGTIDFLINQNPKKQAQIAANYMVDYLALKKKIPQKTLLPLDIISKENLQSFL